MPLLSCCLLPSMFSLALPVAPAALSSPPPTPVFPNLERPGGGGWEGHQHWLMGSHFSVCHGPYPTPFPSVLSE